jgi:ABC-type nitrate/sulfonate/bicarbonate transport system permease component
MNRRATLDARGALVHALSKSWRAIVLLAALLGVWELFVDLGGADQLILPAPHAVAGALFNDRALLWSNFLITAEEILLGIGLAAVVGLALAVALHLSQRTLRPAVYPLLIASQAIPVVLLAPVLVLWLGFGLVDKLVVIAIVSFFAFVVTTLGGLSSVDPELIKLMRTLDASRGQIFRFVELPAALPGLLTGAKIAVVFAPIAAVLAEQAGSGAGLGYVLQEALGQYLVARMWAAVFILAAFAVALFSLLTLAERYAVPWAHRPRGDRP